jgi:hypothetical protein
MYATASPGCERLARRASDAWVGRHPSVRDADWITPAHAWRSGSALARACDSCPSSAPRASQAATVTSATRRRGNSARVAKAQAVATCSDHGAPGLTSSTALPLTRRWRSASTASAIRSHVPRQPISTPEEFENSTLPDDGARLAASRLASLNTSRPSTTASAATRRSATSRRSHVIWERTSFLAASRRVRHRAWLHGRRQIAVVCGSA